MTQALVQGYSMASEPSLTTFAVSALAELCDTKGAPPEVEHLRRETRLLGRGWRKLLDEYLQGAPVAEDALLFTLRDRLNLSSLELMSLSLALCVERETRVSRIVGALQAQTNAVGPTLGLLQVLFARDASGAPVSLDSLLQGGAMQSGLLVLQDSGAPMVERSVTIPVHLVLALTGICAPGDGYSLDAHVDDVPLPPSIIQEAHRHAAGLSREPRRSLVIRAGAEREARAIASQVAGALGKEPLFITSDDVTGLAPWLYLAGRLPVFERSLGPADRFRVPLIARYDGPCVIAIGRDGSVDLPRGSALVWSIPVPMPAEREQLWWLALQDDSLASQLAPLHRQGSSRIAELGHLARQRAEMDRRAVVIEDVAEVALSTSASGLDALAEPVLDAVTDDALVLPATTDKELALLATRCRVRETLAAELGIAAKTRYRPGVRALLTGPSGTGKTLAAAWLATKLRCPLYRVDVASIVSKYIGETEKNLAQLLTRAEHAAVMLLFDEADSLFGKRTEVRQANDRFANTQTNYLLQRMESYEGIVVLTSNNRSRFDAAFTRRLDFIIDFPEPGPELRRELWLRHLGDCHSLSQEQVNQLSVTAELCGGHIRNVVLCAAVLANEQGKPISWDNIYEGLSVEYRKLGKQVPGALRLPAGAPRKRR